MENLTNRIPTYEEYLDMQKKEQMIQPGDVLFTNINNISMIEIVELDSDQDENMKIETIMTGGGVGRPINEALDPMLIAIKYLGNGIFEEIVTKEKIYTMYYGLYLKHSFHLGDPDDAKHFIDIKPKRSQFELDYEDYKKECELVGEKPCSKYEYYKILQEIMERNVDCPLMLSEWECYSVNDTTKQQYLKYSNDERKAIIDKLKKNALQSAKTVNERITESMVKLENVTDEEVEMANLDNQLFDFERGRTK